MRNLPKLWWILLILFFPLAGSIALRSSAFRYEKQKKQEREQGQAETD